MGRSTGNKDRTKKGHKNKMSYTKVTSIILLTLIATMEMAPLAGLTLGKEDDESMKIESTIEGTTEEDEIREDSTEERDTIPTSEPDKEDANKLEDTPKQEKEDTPGEDVQESVTEVNDKEVEEEDLEEEDVHSHTTDNYSRTLNVNRATLQSTNNYIMATDADFSGTTNGTFRYIGKGDYVEIPHTIKGVNVTSYENMFEWSTVKGVKSTNKNITNMARMFYSLQSETLDVSQLDTTNVKNMEYMFSSRSIDGNDSMLKQLDLSNFYTGKVKNMYSMFGHSRVEELNLRNFDTSNVENMGHMFRSVHSKTLDLRSFDTTNVNDMTAMFYEIKTPEVDVSSFDTSSVTTMDKMFGSGWNGMNRLTKLDIRNFNTSNVRNMSSMFKGTLVKELDLSNFDTSNVTGMGHMFYEADIEHLDLSSFDTRKVLHMHGMFYGSLATRIDISSFRTPSLINMGQMFMNTRVTGLDLSMLDTSKVITMTEMFRNSRFEELDLSTFDTSKVNVMGDMFRDSKATRIDLSSFNTENVKNMGFMFSNTQAKELKLGNFNTSKVTNMSYMFSDSRALTIDVSSFDTRNVTSMSNMFENAKAEELDVTSFNTQRITDMGEMFKGSQAKTIKVSNFDTKYVTKMDGMFQNTKTFKLDLGSFDMGTVNDTTAMFKDSIVKTITARTNRDLTKLKNSTGIPAGVTINTLYKVAKDEDFSGFYNGNFRYVGKDAYVEMPHKIKGTNVTNYTSMFSGTGVEGVISTNTNVTNMSYMFEGNTARSLDVSGIYTENVSHLEGMFKDTKTTQLDVSDFNTKKVVNTSRMFENALVEKLDLGSFDLTETYKLDNMFKGSKVTAGYARSSSDATKLNNSSYKPTGMNFTVWGLNTEQSEDAWTNKPVDIHVEATNDLRGISYVEMVNEPGRNLLPGTTKGNSTDEYKGIGVTRAERKTLNGYTDTYSSKSIEPLLEGTYTLSFYAKSTVEEQLFYTYFYNPNTTTNNKNSQGNSRYASDGNSSFTASTDWERYWVTYEQTPSSTPKNIIVGRIFGIGDISIAGVELEEGDTASPWSPAPEDSETTGEQKDNFTVYNNGTYIFRATDTEGDTKIASHTVNNIDTIKPTAELTSSPEGWTSQDVTVYVDAKDDLSGVDYITLPNGNKVNGSKVEYPVAENGEYKFKITDKAGNETTYTETITNIDKTVPKLTSKVDDTKWTDSTVNITVESGKTASGVSDIELMSSPLNGINLLRNSLFKGTIGDKHPEGWGGGNGSNGRGTEIAELVDSPWEVGGDKAYHIKVKDDRYYLNKEDKILVTPGDKITTSIYSKTNTVEAWYDFYDKDGVKVGTASQQRFIHYEGDVYYYTLTVPENAETYGIPRLGVGTSHRKTGEDTFSNLKVEVGEVPTPYEESLDDSPLVNNAKKYNVGKNGIYTFKATYNNGATSETSVNVTNIDSTKPEVTVKGNIVDWTEDESITLNINAKDTQSGVKSITLPDGTTTTSTSIDYKVNKNGDYKFIVTDNVGNTLTHTETVEYLMIPYSFYIYDTKGNPVSNAEFELLRNGEGYKKEVSDDTGLVDFGRIPPTGSYQIRQVTAPGGVVIDPEDIETGDVTEPIEIISYPRGTTLPSTGTWEIAFIWLTILAVLTGFTQVRVKMRKLKKR